MEKDTKKTTGFYDDYKADVYNFETKPPKRSGAGDKGVEVLEEETTAAKTSEQTRAKPRPKRRKTNKKTIGASENKAKQEGEEGQEFRYLVKVESETRSSCAFHMYKEYEKVIKNIASYGRDPEGKRIKNVGQAMELIVEKFLNSLDAEDRKLFLETEQPLSKFKF